MQLDHNAMHDALEAWQQQCVEVGYKYPMTVQLAAANGDDLRLFTVSNITICVCRLNPVLPPVVAQTCYIFGNITP